MNLAEEITIYQFGQGVHSYAHLLDHFSQLKEDEKSMQFMYLNFLVWKLKPTPADIEQAIADSSLTNSHVPDVVLLKHFRSKMGVRWIQSPPDDEIDQGYGLLLHLFKTTYQRDFALKKGNSSTWQYRDLSSNETVQDILTSYQALVEDVYNTPGYRSEFVSIAKFWYHDQLSTQAHLQEPPPEPQTHFDFLTYDEVVDVAINGFVDKYARSIGALRHSVENALAIQYRLPADEARRLVLGVIERHLRETYNTGLY